MPDISGRCAPLREKNSPWFYGVLLRATGLASYLPILLMLKGLAAYFLYAYADKYEGKQEREEILF